MSHGVILLCRKSAGSINKVSLSLATSSVMDYRVEELTTTMDLIMQMFHQFILSSFAVTSANYRYNYANVSSVYIKQFCSNFSKK